MSILLAQHINAVLTGSVSTDVGGRIYLEGADNDIQMPYIVYDYVVNSGNVTKDRLNRDTCVVTVNIYDRDGVDSLELADEIRAAFMSNAEAIYADFNVTDTEFDTYTGQLVDGIYIRSLQFTIKTD